MQHGKPKSTLEVFVDKLIAFFDDLAESYPEEREIKSAVDILRMTKLASPATIRDLFLEYVVKPLRNPILQENEEVVLSYAKEAIKTQFNEMNAALLIFDRHWPEMSDSNRKAIWNHLKVLVLLSEKTMSRV